MQGWGKTGISSIANPATHTDFCIRPVMFGNSGGRCMQCLYNHNYIQRHIQIERAARRACWMCAGLTLKDPSRLRETICKLEIPFVDNGRILTHNSYLNGTSSKDCINAIIRIVPEMDIDAYCDDMDILANSGVLSAIKADFYKQSLEWRHDDILKPALRQAELLGQGGSQCLRTNLSRILMTGSSFRTICQKR